ncbi:MAG: hypothetical protein IKL26_03875 [Bacteroidales bacterium]|nr:hypothetical protein [Bacteroidales bacterium]
MSTLEKWTDTSKIPSRLFEEILPYCRFSGRFSYNSTMKPTDIIKEVSRVLLTWHDWEYEGKEKNTTKILSKVAKNVKDNDSKIFLALHLSTFCDKTKSQKESEPFNVSLLDSGVNLDLLYGGLRCNDGCYTQVAGFSALSPTLFHNSYRDFDFLKPDLRAELHKAFVEKKVIGASGRINKERFKSAIFSLISENEKYYYYYDIEQVMQLTEMQELLNKKKFGVSSTDEEKSLYIDAGFTEDDYLDFVDAYEERTSELELGEVTYRSTRYISTHIKQVTFDVYDESCNIYLQRFTREGDEYVRFYLDRLPETSAIKYLTKLF